MKNIQKGLLLCNVLVVLFGVGCGGAVEGTSESASATIQEPTAEPVVASDCASDCYWDFRRCLSVCGVNQPCRDECTADYDLCKASCGPALQEPVEAEAPGEVQALCTSWGSYTCPTDGAGFDYDPPGCGMWTKPQAQSRCENYCPVTCKDSGWLSY